jgi:Tfp pilus assembly protein PilE
MRSLKYLIKTVFSDERGLTTVEWVIIMTISGAIAVIVTGALTPIVMNAHTVIVNRITDITGSGF